jgi:hypothetical protein
MVAEDHELLGERIDDIRRRTLVVGDRQIVTLERPPSPVHATSYPLVVNTGM